MAKTGPSFREENMRLGLQPPVVEEPSAKNGELSQWMWPDAGKFEQKANYLPCIESNI